MCGRPDHPDDVPNHKIEVTFRPTADQYHPSQPQITDADIDKALAMIAKVEKPVAFFGVGAKGAKTEAKEFVEKYSIPFNQTMPAKEIIDDSHPNALGQVGKLGTKPVYEAMFDADLLILVGTDYPYALYINHKIPAIQIDLKAIRIGHRHNIDRGIVPDAKSALTLLNKHCQAAPERLFLATCRKNMQTWRKWMSWSPSPTPGVLPSRTFSKMSGAAPDDTVQSIDLYLDVRPALSHGLHKTEMLDRPVF